jgi:DNA-binding NarL/FixJ family response regulator
MLKAGAVGYIFKTIGKAELTNAIKTISNGDTYFAKEASKMIMEHFMQKNQGAKIHLPSENLDQLTKREKEVLKLIAEEYTNPEIAEKLFLSARTIDTHRRNLLQKLRVKNTAGLVKIALKSGLIE